MHRDKELINEMLVIKRRPYELVKGEKYLSVNNYVKDYKTGYGN